MNRNGYAVGERQTRTTIDLSTIGTNGRCTGNTDETQSIISSGTTQQEETKHNRSKTNAPDPSDDADFRFDVTLNQSQHLRDRKREHSQVKTGSGGRSTSTTNTAEEAERSEAHDERSQETTGEGGLGEDEGANYDEASGVRVLRVGRWSKRRVWVNPDAFNIEYTDEENLQAIQMGLKEGDRYPGGLVPM